MKPLPSKECVEGAVAYVAACTNVPAALIMSRSRLAPVSHARQQVMWFLRSEGYSLIAIARWFECDHTTVLHAVRAVEERGHARFRMPDREVIKLKTFVASGDECGLNRMRERCQGRSRNYWPVRRYKTSTYLGMIPPERERNENIGLSEHANAGSVAA